MNLYQTLVKVVWVILVSAEYNQWIDSPHHYVATTLFVCRIKDWPKWLFYTQVKKPFRPVFCRISNIY